MGRDSCMARVGAGVAIGGGVGGAVGAVYGTYEAIKFKVGYSSNVHVAQQVMAKKARRVNLVKGTDLVKDDAREVEVNSKCENVETALVSTSSISTSFTNSISLEQQVELGVNILKSIINDSITQSGNSTRKKKKKKKGKESGSIGGERMPNNKITV